MRTITLFLMISLSMSCSNLTETRQKTDSKTLVNNKLTQVQFSPTQVDSLLQNGLLKKKDYDEKSKCGGDLSGYYFHGRLLYINSINGGEFSFQNRKVYLTETGLSQIIFRPHVVYKENSDIKKIDSWKITNPSIQDTIYKVQFHPKLMFEKRINDKLISTTLDVDLVNNLINCSNKMVQEMAKKKINRQNKFVNTKLLLSQRTDLIEDVINHNPSTNGNI